TERLAREGLVTACVSAFSINARSSRERSINKYRYACLRRAVVLLRSYSEFQSPKTGKDQRPKFYCDAFPKLLPATSVITRPGNFINPRLANDSTGRLSPSRLPVKAKMVGTTLRLSYGSVTARPRGMPVRSPPANINVECVEMRNNEPWLPPGLKPRTSKFQ